MKRSSTTSVSRFFLETLVVASNDAGLAKATIDLGRSDVGRRYVGLDPSLPIVLSCAGMRWPRRPKLRSPCCAYDEGRDYWDLAALEIQTFRPTRCSRAQAGRLPHHFGGGTRNLLSGKMKFARRAPPPHQKLLIMPWGVGKLPRRLFFRHGGPMAGCQTCKKGHFH